MAVTKALAKRALLTAVAMARMTHALYVKRCSALQEAQMDWTIAHATRVLGGQPYRATLLPEDESDLGHCFASLYYAAEAYDEMHWGACIENANNATATALQIAVDDGERAARHASVQAAGLLETTNA